ncbi:MAG: hypothetical protein WD688_20245 [Candidatus Binatia bacterium]
MSSHTSDKRLTKPMSVSTPDSRSEAAIKAWATRHSVRYRAAKSEKASKIALSEWCQENGWKVVFFEGATGSPRTGIVDAVIVRIKPREPDAIEVRLVQLKAGVGGLTGSEITRLKNAVAQLSTDWLLAAFDGQTLHLVPDIPARGKRSA